LGVIAPGAYADVVAVVGDPLASVKIVGNVGFVMKDGKVFKNDLGQKRRGMKILEMCDSDAESLPIDATAERAIRTMLDRHVGAVAVVDENQRVAGIFTERDVRRRLSLSERDPRITSVREVMTTPVEMATLATTPGEA